MPAVTVRRTPRRRNQESVLRAEAEAVGADPVRLLARLRDTKKCLSDWAAAAFRGCCRFVPSEKRLYAPSGDLALEWRVRLKPDEPVTADNQQTSVGTVVVVQLRPLAGQRAAGTAASEDGRGQGRGPAAR